MPKSKHYNFFKNAQWAFEGVVAAARRERAFQIELALSIPTLIFVLLVKHVRFAYKVILFMSIANLLSTELINSSLEAVTDLAEPAYNPKAKFAKDTASGAVFFSILVVVASLVLCIVDYFLSGKESDEA